MLVPAERGEVAVQDVERLVAVVMDVRRGGEPGRHPVTGDAQPALAVATADLGDGQGFQEPERLPLIGGGHKTSRCRDPDVRTHGVPPAPRERYRRAVTVSACGCGWKRRGGGLPGARSGEPLAQDGQAPGRSGDGAVTADDVHLPSVGGQTVLGRRRGAFPRAGPSSADKTCTWLVPLRLGTPGGRGSAGRPARCAGVGGQAVVACALRADQARSRSTATAAAARAAAAAIRAICQPDMPPPAMVWTWDGVCTGPAFSPGGGTRTASAAGDAAVNANSAPASVARAVKVRRMRVMVSSGVGGGGLGRAAQAYSCQAPRGCGGRVVRARAACPPGLGGEAVAGCGPQQFVLAGLRELVVDGHGWAPFGWLSRRRLGGSARRLRRASAKGVEGLLQSG